ncbi:MAG: hypothetical protein A2252_04995 [Elusimicrobia bacterium RIFOXYA2_FULL_39_19]|nr:MAG: hypothetical protein A2252_04995 [Elusimicrobia bacterium RIFOXYA2_FULL_39_19]
MKNINYKIFFIMFVFSAGLFAEDKLPPLKTFAYVDVSRCNGRWYEIAKYPNFFQRGLIAGTADWSIDPDGDIRVYFIGKKGNLKGKEIKSKLKGWVSDKQTNTKFVIRFFWPFSGEYCLIDVGKDYEYAVVSKPSRKHLWILSRTPQMDEQVYQKILDSLKEQCFDLEKLTRTPQINSGD